MEMVDFKSQTKNRSLVFVSQETELPTTKKSASSSIVKQVCAAPGAFYADFDTLFNRVCERYIQRIIKNEQHKLAQVSSEHHAYGERTPECYLMIGDAESNGL